MRHIGILGGTLNPIHFGHLMIAQTALEELNLDEVLFMPSGHPPHKQMGEITDGIARAEMIQLAIKDNEKFVYSDFELRREGVIYTSDTLQLLRKEHPDTWYYFIMGADSLLYLDQWHEPAKILENATILVADRSHQLEKMQAYKEMLERKYNICDIRFLSSPMLEVSSSDIRKRVQEGKSVKYLVGREVEAYIKKKKLYV